MRSAVVIVVFAFVLFVQAQPDPNRMLTDPYDCSGWPEPRLYMESQWWFTKAGFNVDTSAGHVHSGCCLPYGQTWSGAVTIHVLVQLHNISDRYVDSVFVDAEPTSNVFIELATNNTKFQCSGVANCKFVYVLKFDTTKVGYNGVVSFDIGASTAVISKKSTADAVLDGMPSDGLDAATPLPRRTTLSRSLRSTLRDSSVATEGSTYSSFTVHGEATGDGDVSVEATGVPVLEHWTQLSVDIVLYNGPNLKQTKGFWLSIFGCGFGSPPWGYTCVGWDLGPQTISPWMNVMQTPDIETTIWRLPKTTANVTRSFVSLDPSFHADPPFSGTVLTDAPSSMYQHTFVDTKTLKNGLHRLFMRADAYVAPNASPLFPPGGTNTGVLALMFNVANK